MAKSTHQAIEEFVEAIAEHYLAVKSKTDDQNRDSVAEEFVSAIESDLRSTLRDRLSKIETRKQRQDAITTADSKPDLAGTPDHIVKPGGSSAGAGNLEATIESNVDFDEVTHIRQQAADFDRPTLDSGAASDRSDVVKIVRGGSTGKPDLSFDDGVTIGQGDQPPTIAGEAGSSRPPASAPAGYELLRTLGEGGMGVVYQARHIPLNRMVAIKMIISGANASPDQLNRFQREAEAAAHLKHPNIVSVYEVGSHLGMPFFSLEYVEGQSLSERIRESTLSPRDAARLLVPVARAIEYSHQRGVLHRDLKPQNILLASDETPKVADFGLAKRLDDAVSDEEKTREGVILGTPGYMAPEQVRDTDRVGPHTDVYALGCILYYLMIGRPPFVAPTPFETVRQMLLQDPLPPSRLQTGLDRDLETICLKALEKDIARRYGTASEFADELQRYVDGEPIVARPITRRERFWKWCKRNPRVATLSGLAASLLLCLLLGGIVSSIVINEQKKAEQTARRQAETNQHLATEQGELAANTTRLLLYKTKEFFDENPQLRELREPLMNLVVEEAGRVYAQNDKYNVNQVFTASADLQLGQIYLNAGFFEKARDKLLKSERLLKSLNDQGNVAKSDLSQMQITLALGDTYRNLGELKTAQSLYLQLEQQRQDYFTRNPQFDRRQRDASMCEVYGKLATVYRLLGKPKESLDYNTKSVQIRRQAFADAPQSESCIAELAGALTLLSASYESIGEIAKMLDCSSEALRLQIQVAAKKSDMATIHNLAKDQKVVARQYLLLNKDAEAKALLDRASQSLEDLATQIDDQRVQNQIVEVCLVKGLAESRLGLDPSATYQRAEQLQRKLVARSDNINSRGMLLKILSRAGKIEEATALAEQMAASPENMLNCGYAACGYSWLSLHLDEEQAHAQAVSQAIELVRQLIRHGYHDFEGMRRTDLDFSPLHHNRDYLAMLQEEQARIKKTSTSP